MGPRCPRWAAETVDPGSGAREDGPRSRREPPERGRGDQTDVSGRVVLEPDACGSQVIEPLGARRGQEAADGAATDPAREPGVDLVAVERRVDRATRKAWGAGSVQGW